MKKLLTLAILLLTFAFSAYADQPDMTFSIGERVVLDHPLNPYREILYVWAIDSRDGDYRLSNRRWYNPKYVYKYDPHTFNPVRPPLPKPTPIKVGQEVMEDFGNNGTRSIQKVIAISDGQYLLSDNKWYPSGRVHRLMTSLKGISTNEEVMEDRGESSIQKVLAISDRMFLLSDGEWYPFGRVHKIDCESGEENGSCTDSVYADNRSQTRMMEKSDQINASPASATGSSSAI